MARLTRSQIKQIQQIIKEHMNTIGTIVIGDGQPSPRLVKKLGLPKQVGDLITSAYKYGKLSTLRGKDLSNMSEEDVKKMMRNLKMTKAQQYSIEHSKIRAQQSIDSINQRLTSNIITMAIQSDLNMWEAVKQTVPVAMENDTPRYEVIQQLREMTRDMERDWHRVAHTEMWSAKCQGEVDAMLNNESPFTSDGAETMIYIKPSKSACNKCKQLYLESDGVTPKVFKISELIANGSNYGKKQADWKACVPPLHPNCLCPINVKPKDTEFDQQGNLIYKPK